MNQPTPSADTALSDCIVIIPTYNEKENISAIIDAVMRQPHPIDDEHIHGMRLTHDGVDDCRDVFLLVIGRYDDNAV